MFALISLWSLPTSHALASPRGANWAPSRQAMIRQGASSGAPEPESLPPFVFRKLDHIVLRVRDMQRMLDFYGAPSRV